MAQLLSHRLQDRRPLIAGDVPSAHRAAVRFALYWFTNTGGSAIRFYYEDAHAPRQAEPTTVPLGVAGFVGDFSGVRRFAERDHKNLVQWNMHPEPGGHYAAHLEPEVLADDIRRFYAGLR
jgi:epoxide hydrolase